MSVVIKFVNVIAYMDFSLTQLAHAPTRIQSGQPK